MDGPAAAERTRLHFRLPLDAARLRRARERIRDYLDQHGIAGGVIDDVVLAVEEAMTNAVRHSGAADGLEVRIAFERGHLHAQVRDQGKGFDAESFDYTRPPDPLETGGRGLFLIAQLMDEMTLVREGGLEVRMLKRDVLPEGDADSSLEAGIVDAQLLEGPLYRQQRLRLVVEGLGEGYAALDWEYRFTYGNAAAYRLYGRTPEEVLGHSVWEIFPHIEKTPLGQAIRESVELGTSAIVEFESMAVGRWLECRIYPTGSGTSLYLRDIDERRRREAERDQYLEALVASEERFRTLFDSMTEGVALHEIEYGEGRPVDYRILAVNPAYERHTGLSEKAVVGRRASEAYGAEDPPYLADYATVVESGEPRRFETYFEPMRRHFRITAVALGGTRFATVFEDITRERRELEREELLASVSHSEEKYRTLFESMDEGFCIIEVLFDDHGEPRDYRFLETNPAFVRQAGLAGAVGRTGRELLPGHEEYWFETYGRIARTGVAERFEDAAEARGRSYDVSAFRFGDPEDGRVAVFFTDVTERRRAEQERERTRKRYRELVQSVNSAIMRWSRDGSITFMNEYAQKLFGWTSDEVIGKHVDILIPQQESTGTDLTGLTRDILDHPERYESNTNENVRRDGSRVWMTWSNHAIVDEQGEVVEILAVGNDVTDLKRTEAALVTSEERYRTIVELADEELVVQADGTYSYEVKAPDEGGGEAPSKSARRLRAKLFRTAALLRRHRQAALLLALAVQVAFLLPIGAASSSRYVLGMPGSLVALTVVVTAAVAGTEMGVLAAIGGGLVFWVAVADFGAKSTLLTTIVSVFIWAAAALIAGLLARALREQSRKRRAAAVALARAETARQAQLVEKQLVEERALSLQRVATALQANLIHPLPEIPGLDMGRVADPAVAPDLVGGDFSDVMMIDAEHVALLIGDVGGKGIKAAGLTETVRSAAFAYLATDRSPASVLDKTNRLLLKTLPADSVFVTACLVVIDLKNKTARVASAGHPPPALLGSSWCGLLTLEHGVPLATFPCVYSEEEVKLARGDCLVLYTDGVTEARRGADLFGEKRIVETLSSCDGAGAQQIAEAVRDSATKFAGQLRDDLQVLVLRLVA